MFTAVVALAFLGLFFGVLLGYSAIHFKVEEDPVADKVSELLPQSQCGQCGFPGCKPYAEAIASGAAPINLCPPGGEPVMKNIANLLGVPPVAVGDGSAPKPKCVAVIDEQVCIGCTVCIKACPVDAILGATRLMHTVITSECTGCEKCMEPCPVDCIKMVPIPQTVTTWAWPIPGQRHDEIALPLPQAA